VERHGESRLIFLFVSSAGRASSIFGYAVTVQYKPMYLWLISASRESATSGRWLGYVHARLLFHVFVRSRAMTWWASIRYAVGQWSVSGFGRLRRGA